MERHLKQLRPGETPSKPNGLNDLIPSSSPAFATPAGPLRPATAAAPRPRQPSGHGLPSHTAAASAAPPPAFPQLNRASGAGAGSGSTVLPVMIPPATLRPLAFRVFTKRHNLTLQASALAMLATFVGKHCGSGWREEGLGEKVLEEAAKRWKKAGGQLIVEGDEGGELAKVLSEIQAGMNGGRIGAAIGEAGAGAGPAELNRQSSFGVSKMDLNEKGVNGGESTANGTVMETQDEETENGSSARTDPRRYLKVISAFDQPRMAYNPVKRHFEKATKPPSLFPEASTRTAFFKQRYHMVHQRLMRNESFQAPTSVAVRRIPSLQRSASSFISQQSYKLSSITDLLGRHGSGHILLGLLSLAPAGHWAISDLTGSVMLDLSLAVPTPDWAWIVPGMMVIVDGTYETEGVNGTTMVGSNAGIGGTIGGRFVASTIAGPPSEKREKTLGIIDHDTQDDFTAASGFGWVDFLGVGSEKAKGEQMRRIEQSFHKMEDPGGRGRIVMLGELNLDVPETFEALRKIFTSYELGEPGTTPMAFILTGNFVSTAGMSRAGTAGSIEYKETFDLLASTLSDYPRLISSATFVFVPGDNDPWASAFSASASTAIPRQGIPSTLTSRIRRVFQAANSDREKTANSSTEGEAIFTSNPTRLSLFGPTQELVILRDDMAGRVRRSLVSFDAHRDAEAETGDEEMQVDEELASEEAHGPEIPKFRQQQKVTDADVRTSRQLVKMIVDQSYLTPFSIFSRPVLWDFASALHMVPLPTAMLIVDPDAPPFAIGYGGCFVMNPGRCLVENRRGQARWIEFDAVTRRGKTMQISF